MISYSTQPKLYTSTLVLHLAFSMSSGAMLPLSRLSNRHIAGEPQKDTWMLLLFSALSARHIAHRSPARTRSPPASPSRSSAARSRASENPRGNRTFTSRCTTLKECRYSSAIAMSSANCRFSAKLNLRRMRHPMKLPPLLDQQVFQTRSAQFHHQHREPLGSPPHVSLPP